MPKQTITMTRDLFDEIIEATATKERERILELLTKLNVIRRDALGTLVAMDTHGEQCIDLIGLEINNG